jgi:iron complex outermembrane recepter protein
MNNNYLNITAGSLSILRISVLIVGIAFCAAPLRAQEDDSTYDLSPFEIDASSDNGYRATETLAGTRMRMNLGDVGASLTVMTAEFMEDLGVNTFEEALIYTPSVDLTNADNTDQNRASGTQMRYGTGQSYSIRGFNTNAGNQSVSHDFFDGADSPDNYNLERVTLSLGPNALLIGVGNPQGVAITSTKRAQFSGNATSIRLQADRYSSFRASIDHNQVLIEDKLAIRVNLLHDKNREFRRYAGKDQERGTVSLAFKPWENTTFRVHHESYDVHRNIAPLKYQYDAGVLRWLAAGKPTVDFVNSSVNWTTTRAYVDHLGNRIPVAAGVVDEDGFVDSEADFDPNDAISRRGGHSQDWVIGLPGVEGVVNYRYSGQLQANTFNGVNSNNYQQESPWELTGIPKDANLFSGTWDDPSSLERGRWTHIFLEQKLAENLYLELAHNTSYHRREFTPGWSGNISVDVNRYLPDNTLNPGYLQYYGVDTNQQFREVDTDINESRATLSYELDLTEKSYWLGKHSFSALWSDKTFDNDEDLLRNFNVAAVGGGNGWNANATNGGYGLTSRSYFIDGNVPILGDSVQILKNKDLLESYGNLMGVTAVEQQPIDISRRMFLPARKNRAETESLSFGWQGKWFENKLITVVGYREDDVESYIATGTRDVIDPGLPSGATNANHRFYDPGSELPFDDEPLLSASGITRTYSAVYHATDWMSVFYNESSNFLPVSNATWVNALGESPANGQGETQDYGVRFNFMDNRLAVELTKFETTNNNEPRNANADAGGARNTIDRLRNNYRDGTELLDEDGELVGGHPYFSDMLDDGAYPIDTGAVSDTWNYVASGYELTVTFNPTSNWRIALSGSENKNQLGTHLAALGRYMYERDTKFEGLATWRNFASELRKVEAGTASTFFNLDPTQESHRIQAANDALYIEQQTNALEINYQDDIALTGVTTAQNGKYAANFLATYTFDDASKLKGWSIGGNGRWRSANILGYNRFDVNGQPTGFIDTSRAVEGDDFFEAGMLVGYRRPIWDNKANLRVQLNVQNLFNETEARKVSAGYDTRGVYGVVNDFVPIGWELRRPRNVVLTTTIEF